MTSILDNLSPVAILAQRNTSPIVSTTSITKTSEQRMTGNRVKSDTKVEIDISNENQKKNGQDTDSLSITRSRDSSTESNRHSSHLIRQSSKPWWLSSLRLFESKKKQQRASLHYHAEQESVVSGPPRFQPNLMADMSMNSCCAEATGRSNDSNGRQFDSNGRQFDSNGRQFDSNGGQFDRNRKRFDGIGVTRSRHNDQKDKQDNYRSQSRFNPVEFFESFFYSFKQVTLSPGPPTKEILPFVPNDSPTPLGNPLVFRNEQLTSAHLETVSAARSHPPLTPPSNAVAPTMADPVRLCSVVFFDLDDTLIPTDWVRRAFVAARNFQARRPERTSEMQLSYPDFPSGDSSGTSTESVTIYEALSPQIQCSVRQHLEELGGEDFDERAADIIAKACKAFGVVVVVTNARSLAWLRIVSDLFPKFKAQLRRFSVPIIRAAVPPCGTTSLKTEFASVGEYFQYWTNLKRLQFSRVAIATREVLSALHRTAQYQLSAEATHPDFLANCATSWLDITRQPAVEEEADMFTFREVGDMPFDSRMGRSISESNGTTSGLIRLSGGEMLLSPRSHGKESHELEDILRRNEIYMAPLDDTLLIRIVAHQVRRFLLHHHSLSHTNVAELPYSPRCVLSGPFPTFPPSQQAYSRYTLGVPGIAPLRPQGQPFHDIPHLPDELRRELSSRQAARSSPEATSSRVLASSTQWNSELLLDIICIGDSEFELCAARELATANPQTFRAVGLIKCRPGLPPDAFRDQLDEVEAAMAVISIDREDIGFAVSGVKHLGPFVSAEFVTRAGGFRSQSLGLSLIEREALRYRVTRPLSELAVKGVVGQPTRGMTIPSHTIFSGKTRHDASSRTRSRNISSPTNGDRKNVFGDECCKSR